MKKTLIAVAMAAFVSTGAFAGPMPHNAHGAHTNHHSVHMASHNTPRPVPHAYHHHMPAPAPVVVHHSHHHHNDAGAILLGDAIIAFAILATNAM